MKPDRLILGEGTAEATISRIASVNQELENGENGWGKGVVKKFLSLPSLEENWVNTAFLFLGSPLSIDICLY